MGDPWTGPITAGIAKAVEVAGGFLPWFVLPAGMAIAAWAFVTFGRVRRGGGS